MGQHIDIIAIYCRQWCHRTFPGQTDTRCYSYLIQFEFFNTHIDLIFLNNKKLLFLYLSNHSRFHLDKYLTGRTCRVYSVSRKKIPPWSFLAFFSKLLGIFSPNFTYLLYFPIYAGLQIFIQLSLILTKLCHIKRNHPVHSICSKCSPSAETHAGIFWNFFLKPVEIFGHNFTNLLLVPIYATVQIFIQLSLTVSKLCHIKCDHPASVSTDGLHFEHIMVVALNMDGVTSSKLQIIK